MPATTSEGEQSIIRTGSVIVHRMAACAFGVRRVLRLPLITPSSSPTPQHPFPPRPSRASTSPRAPGSTRHQCPRDRGTTGRPVYTYRASAAATRCNSEDAVRGWIESGVCISQLAADRSRDTASSLIWRGRMDSASTPPKHHALRPRQNWRRGGPMVETRF